MARQETIPIVVGVTGHRNIRSEDRDVLYGAVARTLAELRSRCPHSELLMLNSLAEGADHADAAQTLAHNGVLLVDVQIGAFPQGQNAPSDEDDNA